MKLSLSARNLNVGVARQHFQKQVGRSLGSGGVHRELTRTEGASVGEVADKLDVKAGSALKRVTTAALGIGGWGLAGFSAHLATASLAVAGAPLLPGILFGAATALAVAGGTTALVDSIKSTNAACASTSLKKFANQQALTDSSKPVRQDPTDFLIAK